MNYILPDNISLGEILGLQFNNYPGITTICDNNIWTLKNWPEELGEKPTQEQIDIWLIELNNKKNINKATIIKSIIDDDSENIVLLRSIIKVLFTSLVEARIKINQLISESNSQLTPLVNKNWEQSINVVKQVIDNDIGV